MKTKEELKKELHSLIDSIQDEHLLNVLNDDILPYIIENRAGAQDAEEELLTDEQIKKLDEAILQADEGKVMDLNEFKRKMATWHIN